MKLSFAASAALVLATAAGCSSPEGTGEHSDDLVARATGLWVLESEPQAGDIELLQLSTRDYASLVRVEEPLAESMSADVPEPAAASMTTGAEPAPMTTEVVGSVSRAWPGRATLSIEGPSPGTFKVKTVGDQLTLTSEDGRVLTYRRSYRLYCVPSDPSVEATMLIEMGATPKIVGVNGDGRAFPTIGDYVAKVRTDELVRDRTWVVESKASDATITVELPWSDMTRPLLEGTVTIARGAENVEPNAITCERVIDL